MKKILSKFFKKSDYQNMSLEDIDFTDLKKDDLIFILNKIGEQVRINPNNYELGRTVRGIYHSKNSAVDEKGQL
tara:strand:+ start:3263 stop:3484 length:222 start_codon:yes stop_codon:yes gene_type:complete